MKILKFDNKNYGSGYAAERQAEKKQSRRMGAKFNYQPYLTCFYPFTSANPDFTASPKNSSA